MDTQNWRRIRTGAYEHTTLDADIIKDRDSWRLFVNGASVTCFRTRGHAENAVRQYGATVQQRAA
jgi:hypothetical protein